MEIFKLFGSIFVDSAAAEESISKTDDSASSLGDRFTSLVGSAAKMGVAVGAAALAVGTAITGIVANATQTATEIEKFANQAGLSVEEYQKLDAVMQNSGWSMEQSAGDFSALAEKIMEASDATSETAELFATLGVETENLDGSLRSTEDVFNDTILALQNVENQTERSAIASQLLGTTGEELASTLALTNEEFLAMKENADVIDESSIDKAVAFSESWNEVKTTFSNLATELGISLMPILNAILEFVTENSPIITEKADEIFKFIEECVEKFAVFWQEHGDAIVEITTTIFSAIELIVTEILNILSAIFETFIALITGDWEGFWDGLVSIVQAIGTAMYNVGKAAFNMVWEGMKSIWTSISSWVSEKVSWLVDKLSFWNSATSSMGGDDDDDDDDDSDGSHASGLPYVPYDGYTATLHRGERVLNADDNQNLATSIVNGITSAISGVTNSQTVNLVVNLDSQTIATAIYEPLNERKKQLGGA